MEAGVGDAFQVINHTSYKSHKLYRRQDWRDADKRQNTTCLSGVGEGVRFKSAFVFEFNL